MSAVTATWVGIYCLFEICQHYLKRQIYICFPGLSWHVTRNWWLETMGIYSAGPEARIHKSTEPRSLQRLQGRFSSLPLSVSNCSGVSWPVASSFQPMPLWLYPSSSSASFPLCVSERLLVFGHVFKAKLENPGWSPHLKMINLVTFAKTLFPQKVTFTGPRG